MDVDLATPAMTSMERHQRGISRTLGVTAGLVITTLFPASAAAAAAAAVTVAGGCVSYHLQ